jgi:Pyruvate/2-oxoacid:ferredoxin oxidoreductase delta subunit
MPKKYHIHPKAAPPRFRTPGKLSIIDFREDCAQCHNCVKRRCVYGFYRDESDVLREHRGYMDYIYQCKGCLSCVQNCTKGILTQVVNPEYKKLGDGYYDPDIILTTWFQAETGSIPVSGSGYGGKFSGPGFDSMWTDMSEIVRPTRDGIHGREYINTSVELGRKLPRLCFEGGVLADSPPPRLESPVPILFDIIPENWQRGPVVKAIVEAAAHMGLFAVVRGRDVTPELSKLGGNIIPLVDPGAAAGGSFPDAPMLMLEDAPGVMDAIEESKARDGGRIVAIRMQAGPDSAGRITRLAAEGAEVIHLVFDRHGLAAGARAPRHARDVLREVHTALVKEKLRDRLTIAASGGIAMAEHMAKAIICGADLVAIDLPLLIALECRLCLECARGEECQVRLENIGKEYAVQRIVNLVCAWRNQLLELMGAMGIREVRRLCGETGRCMFFEDLERESFAPIFGKRKEP